MQRTLKILTLLAATGLPVLSALGQAPAPPGPPGPSPLAAERTAFLRQILADSQLLTEQYERALAKLESELAAAADYEEARLVQQRRNELKALYANGDSSLAQSLATPLLPAQARLSGSAEVRGDELTGWRSNGSAAEWTNVRIPPGRYHLELEANLTEVPAMLGSLAPGKAQPQKRATFDFYEVSLLADAEENRRTFDITTSANDITFTPLRIGPVNFTRSPVTLRLGTATGYPGNVVRLRNLRLVPITEEVISAAPSLPASAVTLAEKRQDLAQSLAAVQRPIVADYLAKLRAAAAAQPAVREVANAEIKHLEKVMESSRNDGSTFLRLFASRTGVAGFEDLDGARFVADPGNTGDRFLIEHDGKQLRVRLMWIQAAALDEKDPSRKGFAKHFGVEEDAVGGLARAAQEFTAGYLEGKPLRLLVRPAREKDGAAPALLFLPEIGLYQSVLVDQGLAAVQPPQRSQRLPAMERALVGFLLEREAAAKRQKTGAWLLSKEVAK